MNASELAKQMLLWEQKRRELDDLEASIKTMVLEVGKTQTVGNVRASYRKGAKRYDYKAACDDYELTDEEIETFSTVQIDWRRVATELRGLSKDELPYSQSDPSVSIKLLS